MYMTFKVDERVSIVMHGTIKQKKKKKKGCVEFGQHHYERYRRTTMGE